LNAKYYNTALHQQLQLSNSMILHGVHLSTLSRMTEVLHPIHYHLQLSLAHLLPHVLLLELHRPGPPL
jgi:hypothetical protein